MSQVRSALRIAVEGCGHGTLDKIYASIQRSCEAKGWDGIDLLIIGGDFQAVRNATDLNCMAVPVKYREIGDFQKYYSGQSVAPYLTVFIGGNHEASNHLWELYYGGWVAPNIYYLGAANVIRLGPLRIAGLSGIWKGYNFKKPHYERLPYNQDDVRSIYHVRELDTRKLLQIRSQIHIGLSHDWPRGIEWLGDWKTLFKRKDHFEKDARNGNLGSVAAKLVMDHLKPLYWFSAHLHIKFAAVVDYTQPQGPSATSKGAQVAIDAIKDAQGIVTNRNEDEIELDLDEDDPMSEKETTEKPDLTAPKQNAEEIDLGESDESGAEGEGRPATETVPAELRAQLPESFKKRPSPPVRDEPDPPTTISNTATKFLALDKCLPKRDFLQLLEVELTSLADDSTPMQAQGPPRLSYDPEWLAITRAFALAEPPDLGSPAASVPRDKGRAHYAPLIVTEEAWVERNVTQGRGLLVPENFERTAPVYDAAQPVNTRDTPREFTNPQTAAFCSMLGIENPFASSDEEALARQASAPRPEQQRDGGFGRGGGRGGGGRGQRGGGNRGWRARGGGGGRGRGGSRGAGWG